jgi:chromosome segregation ATPase
MSKQDNTTRSALSGHLKKDINQAVTSLQHLTSALSKIELSLTEAEVSRGKEVQYVEKINKLQQEGDRVLDRYQRLEEQNRAEIVSYADINLKLTREFDARLKQKDQDRDAQIEAVERRRAAEEHASRRASESQKNEIDRLREAERASQNRLEGKLKEQWKSWQARENQLQTQLKLRDEQLAKVSGENRELSRDLQEHQIMLKGRDTEISRLVNSLASLEAFASKPPDQ